MRKSYIEKVYKVHKFTLDIIMEIAELEYNKTYKYLGINEALDIVTAN